MYLLSLSQQYSSSSLLMGQSKRAVRRQLRTRRIARVLRNAFADLCWVSYF